MNSQQQHYSPFSNTARKWMIAIGSIVMLATVLYAFSNGVVSYFSY